MGCGGVGSEGFGWKVLKNKTLFYINDGFIESLYL